MFKFLKVRKFDFNFKSLVKKIFSPITNIFYKYQEEKRQKKLSKLKDQQKQKGKEIKYREKLREESLKREIKEEEIIARKRESELRLVFKREQKIIRQIQKNKEKKFAETLKIQKQLALFAKREQAEILNLEKIGLNLEREEYRQLQERIDKIRQRYVQLRNERVKKRVEELTGTTFSDQASIEEIRKQEKEIVEQKEHISSALAPYYRSIKSVLHSVNFKYLPKYAELLRVYDLRYEQSEIVVREDSQTENFLLLVYLEDNNPNCNIIVEDKCNDEKHTTRSYSKNQIFQFGDDLIDSVLEYVQKLIKKKAS